MRDRARSVRFFVDALGFSLLSGPGAAGEPAWTAVMPPDGTALLALVEDPPAAGRGGSPIVLLPTDVHGCYDAWTARGVRCRAEAERAERDRRAAYELRLAAEVQARLLPQAVPVARTLDYAGHCRQARRVGGDYYDCFRIGEDRLALVLVDVSGKGMPAALLMASLQACVREACPRRGRRSGARPRPRQPALLGGAAMPCGARPVPPPRSPIGSLPTCWRSAAPISTTT